MRRFLAALALAALCVRAAPASGGDAAEPPPDSLRLRVERDSLVHIDLRRARELLPRLVGDRPVVWWGMNIVDHPEGVPPSTDDQLTFVAFAGSSYEIRAAGHPRLDGRTGGGLEFRVVEDDLPAVEEFGAGARPKVFGSLAAAGNAVYASYTDTWFLAKIDPQGHAELPLQVPPGAVDESGKATILVRVVGTHEGPVRLAARVGSRDAGEAGAASAAGGASLAFEVDAHALEGAERISFEDRSPAPAPREDHDVSEDRGAVWVANVRVHVLCKPHRGLRVDWGRGVRTRLQEVDATSLVAPHRDRPDPLPAARGADEVILSTTELLRGAQRLAEHRSKVGMRSAVVPIADVWDRFGGGDFSPWAIPTMLGRLSDGGHGPRFVLLCGDATYDRTDIVPNLETIPTAYARTKYNGATASDRLLVLPESKGKNVGGPAIGRLPFRDAKTMDAYVDRVIAYETKPPVDPSRRRLDFVTSEGRFGPLIDGMTERLFTGIVAHAIPPAYDVEVTFASASSPFLWAPPEFNDKVIRDIDAGALTFTYVGHGWWDGFDDLRYGGKRFPILRDKDAAQVDVKGTPPAMFVIACTTARFDDPDTTSVGERLLAQPHGPIAYWGATRICHPAWNAVVGRQIAMGLFASKDARVGEILRDAADRAVAGDPADKQQQTIRSLTALMAPGEDMDRLYREGSLMYNLLGDPAVKLALPDDDLRIEARPTATGFSVRAAGDGLADGAEVHLSVEVARDVMLDLPPAAGANATEAERFAAIRARHDKANDKAVSRADVRAQAGSASADLAVPEARRGDALFVKAWTVSGGRVRQGAIELPAK